MKNNLLSSKQKRKSGQIWIESVLYTLIGLALIGTALALMMPKITAMKERTIIDQSVASLATFDSKIAEVVDKGPGNKREISAFVLSRGSFVVDATESKIIITFDDFKKEYSEPGVVVKKSGIDILTTKRPGGTLITLTLDYNSRYNLLYKGANDKVQKFAPTSGSYRFVIENKGVSTVAGAPSGLLIDISEVSS